MKKFLPIVLAVFVVASCGPRYSGPNGEKTQKDAEKEFLASLSAESQAEVLDLAETCMQLLKNGELEDAVDMIYVLHNSAVYQKSENYRLQLINRFKMMPVADYTLEYYNFSTQGNNDISYVTKLGLEEGAPTMKLMFNPVLIDGKWYLAFKDGNMSSKALPIARQIQDMAPAPEEVTLAR